MNQRIKKELKEWLVLIGVFAILYTTGWYIDVIAFMQRGVLETGLMKPEIVESDQRQKISGDFLLIDVNEREVAFSELNDNAVFLNIWATWCMPCIAEMPDIEKLYQKTGYDVNFVMVSRDDDFNKAKEFVAKKGYTFPIYQVRGSLPGEFSGNVIPATYVISSTGEIAARRSGMAKYDTEEFREFLMAL